MIDPATLASAGSFAGIGTVIATMLRAQDRRLRKLIDPYAPELPAHKAHGYTKHTILVTGRDGQLHEAQCDCEPAPEAKGHYIDALGHIQPEPPAWFGLSEVNRLAASRQRAPVPHLPGERRYQHVALDALGYKIIPPVDDCGDAAAHAAVEEQEREHAKGRGIRDTGDGTEFR